MITTHAFDLLEPMLLCLSCMESVSGVDTTDTSFLTFDITAQQWSKKIVKQFKERHGNIKGNENGDGDSLETPKKAATPRKRATPKTPGSGRGKKRAAVNDDDDSSPENSHIADPIAKQKTPRSVKKVKYEEDSDNKAPIEDMAEREDEMPAAGDA